MIKLKNLLKEDKFVWIKRHITPTEHQKIINLREIKLRIEEEKKRSKQKKLPYIYNRKCRDLKETPKNIDPVLRFKSKVEGESILKDLVQGEVKIENSTIEDFEKCFSVNVKAAFVLCKEFSQGMISQKWGRIINIASSSAYAGFKNTSIYCSSKHALLGLSRSLHSELKEHNVRTFCVSPGPIKTSMGHDIVKNENPDERFDSFMNPNEIAEFIAYLVSFDNEMVSEEIRLSRID